MAAAILLPPPFPSFPNTPSPRIYSESGSCYSLDESFCFNSFSFRRNPFLHEVAYLRTLGDGILRVQKYVRCLQTDDSIATSFSFVEEFPNSSLKGLRSDFLPCDVAWGPHGKPQTKLAPVLIVRPRLFHIVPDDTLSSFNG